MIRKKIRTIIGDINKWVANMTDRSRCCNAEKNHQRKHPESSLFSFATQTLRQSSRKIYISDLLINPP